MNGLGSTAARLARYRKRFEELAAAAENARPPSHLQEVTGFGSNPGHLRLFLHVPEGLRPNPPLVVVLHGCTQDAAGYDRGSGWSALAERHGFIVLYPEQQAANNPRTCFNWFQPGDIARGRGEALSIRQMVEHVAKAHGADRSRVFVTGLSAGGAMTAVMLATYPDVFAGGAIVAGLPFGVARDVREALDAMHQGQNKSAAAWGDLVRGASRHKGSWPRVSIWHGDADATVSMANADALVRQWTNVHGLSEAPALVERVEGATRRVWQGRGGEAVVESYTVPGMGHGTPLGLGGADAVGAAGPFLLDVGISSTERIAAFWGLTGERAAARAAPADGKAVKEPAAPRVAAPTGNPMRNPANAESEAKKSRPKALDGEILPPGSGTGSDTGTGRSGAPGIDPGQVITDALTAAGLMRRR